MDTVLVLNSFKVLLNFLQLRSFLQFEPKCTTVAAFITYLQFFTQTSTWIKGFWFPTSSISPSIPGKLPIFQQERLQRKTSDRKGGLVFQSRLFICPDINGGFKTYIDNRGNLACAHQVHGDRANLANTANVNIS